MPSSYRHFRFVLLILFILAFAIGAVAQESTTEREPAPVLSYRGAPWLERPNRVEEEKPYEVIKQMNLENGDVVADIGCGTGFYARKIAMEVAPDGVVYGVDIQPEMLAFMRQYCEDEGVSNVIPVLGDPDDPKLPKESIDWMILADVYHEFQDPETMLAAMRRALKPDGRILLLEYRAKGDSARHIKPEHRMSVEQVKAEWLPAGFELVELLEFLPSQHLFIFRKSQEK